MPGLIGRKIGMTRVIQENGDFTPVTVISVPDATVVHVKTVDKDGYNAVVLGIDPLKKPRKTKKFMTLKEFRFDPLPEKNANVGVQLLQEIKSVSVSAVSKGRGFTGVVKRYHFAGQPGSHGHSSKNKGGARSPGSVGCRSKPGRIKKGKRMAGRSGFEMNTRHHIPVVKLDVENKLVAIKGCVPGPRGNTVFIKF